jgi:hypothetical protein
MSEIADANASMGTETYQRPLAERLIPEAEQLQVEHSRAEMIPDEASGQPNGGNRSLGNVWLEQSAAAPDIAGHLPAARAVLDVLTTDDPQLAQDIASSGIGNSPRFIRAMAKLAKLAVAEGD